MPRAREAANLSRIRSPITSRSNWAKRQQDVQRQPAHRRRGVELLGDADERDVVPVEHLDDAGEVGQRARQPVDLVDDDDVDDAALDVAQQPLQRRALHAAAGEAAVVVAVADQDPALALLALDVGQPRLALRVERVELHLQPLFRGLARVDGAAQLADGCLHLPLR